MIAYYRVDERVIHGQTLNVVTRQMACDGILVVDDEIAADPYFCTIFKGSGTVCKELFCNFQAAHDPGRNASPGLYHQAAQHYDWPPGIPSGHHHVLSDHVLDRGGNSGTG